MGKVVLKAWLSNSQSIPPMMIVITPAIAVMMMVITGVIGPARNRERAARVAERG